MEAIPSAQKALHVTFAWLVKKITSFSFKLMEVNTTGRQKSAKEESKGRDQRERERERDRERDVGGKGGRR